jgi:hypothetical protein
MAQDPNDKSTDPKPADAADAKPDPQPRYMTAEEFNGAMTARERRADQRIAKMLEEFRASLVAAAPAKATDDGSDDDGEGGAAPAAAAVKAQSDRPSKDVLKLKDEVARMKKERQRERDEVEKERQARLVDDANARVQSALVEAGSSGPHTKAAWALLSAEGRIKRNEQGEVCIELPRTYLGKTELELVPVKEAIPEWLNSEHGKLFMPPRGGGEGSGTVVRSGAPRSGGKLSKEEARAEAQRALTNFVLGTR